MRHTAALFRPALLAVLLGAVLRADPPPLARFESVERLGLDWPRTLVTHRFDASTPFDPAAVRLLDAAGEEVPVQLSQIVRNSAGKAVSAWVSFFAELPKEGRYAFALVPGAPQPAAGSSARVEDRAIFLDNGKVAVRLPVGGQRFAVPVSLGDAAVPGPLLGVRLLEGVWTAPASFELPATAKAPNVVEWSATVTATGPLFAEARVTYGFEDGGHYTLTARLVDGEAAVRLDEAMDLRQIRKERDWRVVFPLTDDAGRFRPDAAWWSTPEGRFWQVDEAFEKAAATAGFAAITPDHYGNRRHLGSMILAATEPRQVLMSLSAWYPYAPVAFYAGLAEKRRLVAPREAIPFVAVVPMHAGNWRGIPEKSNGDLVALGAGRVAVSWPLTVSPHPNSLLHTGEYDPDLPYTFLRREWALMAGPMQYHDGLLAFRRYEGYITLDDYKDWQLEWPADPTVAYPRLTTTPEQLANVKEHLETHPMADGLRKLPSVQDDPATVRKLYESLASDSMWNSPRGHAIRCLGRDSQNQRSTGWVAGFRHSQKAGWANTADEVLASQHLSDGERTRLRAWIAACCYALAEPDFNPRGAMVHLGNPNMPMNRFCGLTFAAALIPDHPEARRWLDVSRQYLRFCLIRNTAPGGGWSELLTYYMAAASHLMQAAMVLHHQGLLDDATAALAGQAGRFPLALVAPRDPRFTGARAYPAWGHEGAWEIATQWLPVAAFLRDRDPGLAQAMVWMWDQLGRPQEDHHDASFSPRTIIQADLLTEASAHPPLERLASRWIPGFGATMRSHTGTPDETFLAYRQGYMVSHSDANQGDFLLHARGVPLTTLSLFQYAIYNNGPFCKLYNEFGWHNRVRFGTQDNNGGWPGGGLRSQVQRFLATDSADYLRGTGDYAPQRWTRQILFLKARAPGAPESFVLRDSFAAADGGTPEPKWWYLRTAGGTDRVAPRDDGFTFASAWGPTLDVCFLMPVKVALESRQATQVGPVYNRAGMLWKQAGNAMTGNNVEETMTVTAAGPVAAGQDILTLLVPRRADEAMPETHALAPGVVRVVTPESTDTVFLGPEPFVFDDADLHFRGRAGAVRLFPDAVHLVVAEGPAEVSYRGTVFASDVAAVRVVPRAALEPGRIEQHAPAHALVLASAPGGMVGERVVPGVTRWRGPAGETWRFDSPEPLRFEQDGIVFHGRQGSLERDARKARVVLVLLDGERLAFHNLAVWGEAPGPCEVTFQNDRIEGRTAGEARFFYLSRPAGLDRLPMLVVDGQSYAPGTSADFARGSIDTTGDPYNTDGLGGALIVPALPGEHTFELKVLDQPPIFRNWQAWPEH